ncbi:hypothetical protein C3V37_01640 [Peptostreptococcaceae bacterium oral taxon 929]|nr:hypothetical protein C3V37_01640 [Peptostreptococcaceae bacterium oral taxon 929]
MNRKIKKIIDTWDPYDLMTFAPEDEYSGEVKEIEEYIKNHKEINLESIKELINTIFDFDIMNNNKKDIDKVAREICKIDG